jgi:DNA-binding NarL/FixJ family response regulator
MNASSGAAVPPASARTVLRVVLVEDSPLLRRILAGMLDELGGVEVVGEAADEGAALAVLEGVAADLAIVDLELAAGSGLGVLRALREAPARFGAPRAVVLTNHAHAGVRERCVALGAAAFFDKSLQMEALFDYVVELARNG